MKFVDLIIDCSDSLRTALRRMTQNRCGVLFVCDDDGHLVGALSDGDVRRSLLDDALLISPIGKVMNTDPISAPNAREAITLLHRMNIVAVPVVNTGGQVLEIILEDQESVIVLRNEVNDDVPAIPRKAGALAIVPARGGSKRLPRKNLVNLAGKSLLAWAIQSANNSRNVSHVLVSTDDVEIAAAARTLGLDVPWLRPESLSTDTTTTLEVILHALNWAVQKLDPVPDCAVLLEPTAPLRKPEQIDEAISILMNSDADCVASVSELPHIFHPEEVLIAEQGSLQPYLWDRSMASRKLRTEQGSAYVFNGLVYAFRIQSVLSGYGLFGRKTIPLITPWDDFVDIDTPEDLELANFKIGRSFSHA